MGLDFGVDQLSTVESDCTVGKPNPWHVKHIIPLDFRFLNGEEFILWHVVDLGSSQHDISS